MIVLNKTPYNSSQHPHPLKGKKIGVGTTKKKGPKGQPWLTTFRVTLKMLIRFSTQTSFRPF